MTKYSMPRRPSEEVSVTAVTRYFFTPLYTPGSAWSVVHWWEARRPLFNVSVGGAGLLSVGALYGFAALPPHPAHFGMPFGAVVVYAVLANVGFTLGPAVDLLIRRRWGNRYAAVGQAMFRYGYAFSVGLTLLPIPLAVISWGIRLLIALR